MKVPFWGTLGKSSSTLKVAQVFLESVRHKDAIDQLVIGDEMARITNAILAYTSPISAKEIIRPRLDYFLFAFLMPRLLSVEVPIRQKLTVYILQS